MWQQRLLYQPSSASVMVLPKELIMEIFSLLPVKPLMRFRCVNKFFKTLISDPHFIQMHRNKSKRNPKSIDWCVVDFPISRLLEISSATIHYYPYYDLNKDYSTWRVVGSCNGLLCLTYDHRRWVLWNPANMTKSSEFFTPYLVDHFLYSFGYDNSTGTYKVVAFSNNMQPGFQISMVLSIGDNSWRNIQCFYHKFASRHNNGVYVSGTITWLALRNSNSVTIVSLDLSTETYTRLILPQGFNKVPCSLPKLVVLMDCLCFCHDLEQNHFVIWQMKDFGVQESWIQLFKISYRSFSSCYKYGGMWSMFPWLNLVPLGLSKNGNILILANCEDLKAFIYNCRYNIVESMVLTH